MKGAGDKICVKYAALPPTLPGLHESTHFPAMCFESERSLRWSSPSVKNIADIASVSYRAYKGCRWVKRKLVAHINSHRKREDGLSRMHMKPWPAGANVTRANATDAPRPTADEERKSIQVNVVDHLFLAQLDSSGMDPATLALLEIRGMVQDTTMRDKENKEELGKLGKLGRRAEALCSHRPFAIRRLDATLPDDLPQLAMRANQAHASSCAV